MAETNDTIDGLLAEFRGYSAGMPPSYHVTMSWHDFRVMLDRFEAAHRREKAAIEADALAVGGMVEAERKRERGDCAKLREALIKARSAICHFARHQCKSLSWENSNIQANCDDVLCSWRVLCDAKTTINAALSAPPRNCDVYDSYGDAIRAFEDDENAEGYDDMAEWLFAPATEGGAK